MRRLLLYAVAACALMTATANGSPTQAYTYDRALGTVARASLWQAASRDASLSLRDVLRVYVRCYRDGSAFERAFERRFGESAEQVVAYYVGGGDVHLRNGTCANARTFLSGRHTVYTAGAFAILLHEALHRQGMRNERITTCFANEAVRWGAGAVARHQRGAGTARTQPRVRLHQAVLAARLLHGQARLPCSHASQGLACLQLIVCSVHAR